jgi:hypothetical protein
MNDQQPKPRRRVIRRLVAFLWLTIGYWFISTLVPFILLFLPFATSGGGIEMSSADGVHHVRFPGAPGDIIAVLYVEQRGPKDITFQGASGPSHGGSSHMQWANAYFQLLPVIIFALLSIPVLKRLFRNDRSA